MGYRAVIEANPETVQDLELSAFRRLEEAFALCIMEKHHTAIYIAGLAAEMYLKTACFFLGGARPGDQVDALLRAARPPRRNLVMHQLFESGHGLWFWFQAVLHKRRGRRLRGAPRRLRLAVASMCQDWCIDMRYRPGSATADDAKRFIRQVEWLAVNHPGLRR